MPAILYLVICAAFGISLVYACVPDTSRFFAACSPSKNIIGKLPPALFTAPAGIITGFLTVPAFNYYAIFLLSFTRSDEDMVKRAGILLTFALFIILTGVNFGIYTRKTKKTGSVLPRYSFSLFNTIYYGIVVVAVTGTATFLMFYTFRVSDGIIYSGYSTFSDFAPHTAMISSFSKGFNFPTQYMHFSGDGIRYHFFFYFFAGMLQYLGFSIDFAINIPSIVSMVCALVLAGDIAVIFSRKRAAFAIVPVLVFFRSSLNVFYHIKELGKQGLSFADSLGNLSKSWNWYKVTPYDDWGIWAINVYPNQRHLMLGIGAILLLVLLMTPAVRRMCISLIKAGGDDFKGKAARILKTFIGSREAWIFRSDDPLHPGRITVLCCIIAAAMPFFHGSALIGVLLILALMAVFSEMRLSYAAVAAVSVLSAFLQTRLFAGSASGIVFMNFNPGFVAEDKSAKGILGYLIIVTGITLITAVIYAIYILVRDIIGKKPVYRELMFLCFLVPGVFAFLYQVSGEMLANHKFIQFTIILADIFAACAIAELFSPPASVRKSLPKGWYIILRICLIVIGAVLFIPLTATGISEWCTYININRMSVEMNSRSELVEWIEQNTEPGDVFLTPAWSMNRFFLAGRPAYFGHPYYAWSAGHDTYTRGDIYNWLINGCRGNIDEFRRYCRERNIKYLIDDPEFASFEYPEGIFYNIDFLSSELMPVAYFPEEGTTVYKIN